MNNYNHLSWDDIKAMFVETEKRFAETEKIVKETSLAVKELSRNIDWKQNYTKPESQLLNKSVKKWYCLIKM